MKKTWLDTFGPIIKATYSIRPSRSAQSGQKVMDGDEQTLYERIATSSFEFRGGYFDWTGLAIGETVTIKAYRKIKSGGAYVEFYSEDFLTAALPTPLCTPVPRALTTQVTPSKVDNVFGIKVTAQQAAEGLGWNTLDYEFYEG